MSNLYRGRNAAVPNVGLSVGIQDSPIGNNKARHILAASHIPPPNRSTMQRTSNKVAKQIQDLNVEDMSMRRREISSLVEQCTARPGLNISVDARYNSVTFGNRNKPGTNASQAIMTAVCQEGEEKEIIGLYTQNKLCWNGAYLRSKGYNIKCPNHIECTANTASITPLSEYEMGKQIGKDFGLDNILIENVCSDGDSRSCDGVNDAMKALNPIWETIRQSDTTHLGVGQYKKTLKCKFSRRFFPHFLKTKSSRNNLQKVLAQDLKARCHVVFNNLYQNSDGDINKMNKSLPKIITGLLNCYRGKHKICKKTSEILGCKGRKTNNWFLKSMFLSTLPYLITEFHMRKSDRLLFLELVGMKLSSEALPKLKYNLTTNANEYFNRGLSVNLPKNVNFSRNVYGRAHSNVHRLNNKTGDSLILKLERVKANIPKGSYVAKAINSFQTDTNYHKKYRKRKEVIWRVKSKKTQNHNIYQQMQSNKKGIDMYRKGLLDYNPVPTERPKRKSRVDHTYSAFEWSK